MFRRLTFVWTLIIVSIIGGLYVKFVHPDLSVAHETPINLEEAYNLSPKQVDEWLSKYSTEEVQVLVQEHIQNEIKNGAEPIYGTISLDTDTSTITLSKDDNTEEDSTFTERLFNFLLSEFMSK